NFFYVNCSVPDALPSAPGKEGIKETYRNQIKQAEVVIVLASLFVSDEYWVAYQMDVAHASQIPIVAVEVFGGREAVAEEIARRAAEVVGWNGRNIVDAV